MMVGVGTEVSRGLRGPAWFLDGALHLAALLLVLAAVEVRWGSAPAISAALLFPITYVLGPMTMGIAGGEWLPFGIQLVAILGAVGLAGVPRIDRSHQTSRGCLQLLVSATLLVVVDLALHLASLALVVDRVARAWGGDGALLAAAAFPITYLIGPLWLAVTAADWLPLLLQVLAFGLVGVLIVLSDA
jgi:hypothetical protein